jgi:hypothetical protein
VSTAESVGLANSLQYLYSYDFPVVLVVFVRGPEYVQPATQLSIYVVMCLCVYAIEIETRCKACCKATMQFNRQI